MRELAPGVALALAGAALAWLVHLVLPGVPWLTAAFVVGVALACLPPLRPALDGPLRAGLGFSARTLLRAGIVLLGLDLALGDIAALGWWGVLAIAALVGLAFAISYAIARALRLPGDEPVLLAAGFSICGVSAVGAMAAARGSMSKMQDAATPTALVTLFGTLAIVVLPAFSTLAGALGMPMGEAFFGAWAGASVHDVGQVVATAQTAGPAALGAAVVVKLTRVLALAPMVAVASLRTRRAARAAGGAGGKLPPIVPLFIVGFLALVLVRSFLPVPDAVLDAVDLVRTALLAAALVGIGAGLRLERLVRTGGRAIVAGALAWGVILVLGLGVAAVVAG
ncbi:YeiH family protein [Protaetiibacter intestinalis]|uniref:Putative sulfate exporter family transporter n=1 Tax=Protaetiibacter intestinalis TaxID=2419774 RepID=A0A387BCG9_9MICO|nr:putative sulfate exporter family transporter [Protaetiibacter intestinalis]AYF99398.1 putative sulfate exporter family transporter [Protaetiibacter intestinalis]